MCLHKKNEQIMCKCTCTTTTIEYTQTLVLSETFDLNL